jgi:hypothetical protein
MASVFEIWKALFADDLIQALGLMDLDGKSGEAITEEQLFEDHDVTEVRGKSGSQHFLNLAQELSALVCCVMVVARQCVAPR